jgi:endoglucanase Acf2
VIMSATHAASRPWICFWIALLALIAPGLSSAQPVSVGSGSYTNSLPAGAAAPPSTVYETSSAPVLTHKFWTSKYWNPLGTASHGGPVYMFPQPLSMQTTATGLKLGFFNGVNNNGTWFNQPYQPDLTVGVAGLNATAVNVSATYDWAVDFNWGAMTARVGRGFPFVYLLTNGQNPVVTFTGQPTVFANNGNTLGVSIGGNSYGLFCPSGGTWSGIGTTTLTCAAPAGRNYFSLALLPGAAALSDYAAYAFSFPTDTRVSWRFEPATSSVITTYTISTRAMEGSQTGFLAALYPHQYGTLNGSINTSYGYASPRGPLKVQRATSFSTTDIYHGVLPFLPPTNNYNASTLRGYIDSVAGEGNHFSNVETYGVGKQFNRVAQLLPIAKAIDDSTALDSLKSTLQTEMQQWLTASSGESTKILYYDRNWNTLIGYPASYGSDTSLNDHHFHYGYWIHSAALVGLFDRAWLAPDRWGGMIDLLRQDIANTDRGNTSYPFLRYFDAYAGHSWASGEAPFGDGGNEESSSEAINAWAGLILYGEATGSTAVRDAGIWLYTQAIKGAQYYWFNNGAVSTFPSGFGRVAIANLFDAKSDVATWFGAEPEFSHGIEYLPFTGGSLYLGYDPNYVSRNYNEILSLTGGSFSPATTKWPDLIEEYLAFVDPNTALNQWASTSFVFDGETKAHEYYWLTALQALGQVDTSITANTALYAVFRNPRTSAVTHVAYNAGTSATTVNFSDGASFSVPASSMRSEYGTFSLTSGSTTPDPPTPTTGAPLYINVGGGASGSWIADAGFSGGSAGSTTAAIDTTKVSQPAPPQAVYQTQRVGPMTYTLGGLTAGRSYTVQLHFAEITWNAAGQRRFNVSINGTRVLADFDVLATAGAQNRASEQNFGAQADASGKITVQLTAGSVDQPQLSGIAVF